MKTSTATAIVLIFLAVIIAALFLFKKPVEEPLPDTNQNPIQTDTNDGTDQTISDGTITIAQPGADFGFATNETQILVHSYIPSCSSPFMYCLYYNGTSYQGTNFESAGVRISKRTDLSTERLCMNTPPEGYEATTTPTSTTTKDSYASSVFSNISDAAAGHYASGSLYRLFVRSNNACYEFETRIGETQFANYPEGTIVEFTSTDRAALKAKLFNILEGVSLDGLTNLFPQG
jgi:hypothetical protein